MLTIEFSEVEEEVTIGDFFEEVGFSSSGNEQFIENEFDIEAKSLDDFYQIEGFRWTAPERQVECMLESGISLLCSPEHLLFALKRNGLSQYVEWEKVGNLKSGDYVVTKNNVLQRVHHIRNVDDIEQLCDMQVTTAHSYFVNDVLSHNSHFLVQMAANCMRQKKNVVYYTFELYEPQVSCRLDTNICDIDYDDILPTPLLDTEECKKAARELGLKSQEHIKRFYAEARLGRSFVKFFPNKTASVNTIRNHLERLELKKNFKPDMVVIDYADIMKPSSKYNEKRDELQSLYQELRALAYEKDVAIHTACQSNRGGASKNVVDSDDIAEAYSKVAECDVVMTLSRKSIEKSSGAARLFLTKSRIGTDGWLWNMHLNTARSQFRILGEAQTLEDANKEDDTDVRKYLKKKWNEIDGELKN